MGDSLTAQQLYADLVAAHKRQPIPDGAFTARTFAVDAGISETRARELLRADVDAGRLTRYNDGRRNWYWFV